MLIDFVVVGSATNVAARHNELVAALADEVRFAYITPGGQMVRRAKRFSI